MQTTHDLLNAALNKQTAMEWSKAYNIQPSTIAQAKKSKRLSPMLAGNFAIDLGENAEHWIAVAAMETERDTQLRERLRQRLVRAKP